MKYKIYKLIHNGVVVYVGKTTRTLKKRKSDGGYRGCAVESIYKECDIVLIEETDDVAREDYWIDYYKDTVLNIKRGDRRLSEKEYNKEWRESNREYMKEYRESNREHWNQYRREQYKKNKLKNGQTANI